MENRAQKYLDAQVKLVVSRLIAVTCNAVLTKNDLPLVATEAKQRIKRCGMVGVMSILWGTRFTMQDVQDGAASSPAWGSVWSGENPEFSAPKRHLRILAHAFLCAEVLTRLVGIAQYQDEDGVLLLALWSGRDWAERRSQPGLQDEMSDGVEAYYRNVPD